MKSPSSRRRSGSSGSREDIAALLRDGAAFGDPSEELRRAAGGLENLGLCRTTLREFVRCADPQDRDFPPRVRTCQGRIYVEGDLDEEGGDLRCPSCDRSVYPTRYAKRRHPELRTEVLPAGVIDYVRGQLAALHVALTDVAPGVIRVDLGGAGAFVCILDVCREERYASRDWAKVNRTCYVTVDPEHLKERFAPDAWLSKVELADLVTGSTDLGALLRRLAAAPPPQGVADVSVPVYSKTVPVIVPPAPEADVPTRRFVVEVGTNTVRVEGVEVVAPQGGTRFEVFQILWERFLDDLRAGCAPDAFGALKLKDIVKELDRRTGKGEDDEASDEESVRKVLNNLQADIEKAFKRKVGEPIAREDVIETLRQVGQLDKNHGYRINPRTVCARPFQAPPA